VVDESEVYSLISKLKSAGACDILVSSIDRLVP
ncbi:ATP phosphoribosyltransferase, partial [archaeon SCG-AAA382B04]